MSDQSSRAIAEALRGNTDPLLHDWIQSQTANLSARHHLLAPGELASQSREFLDIFTQALSEAPIDSLETSAAWTPVREFLANVSRSRARQGFTPTETATFVFSLKRPMFMILRQNAATSGEEVTWLASEIVDRLGLFTTESYQKGREEVIARQQQELLELSTPVVELWEGILALPLIGTLDSSRTQVVMESLLQAIVDTGSQIAIVDITGVPLVDTLVAQHLLKTVAAARLMGADCIISGIRPQIAQTIVHLGVDLEDVMTKATLADALAVAMARTGYAVVAKTKRASRQEATGQV